MKLKAAALSEKAEKDTEKAHPTLFYLPVKYCLTILRYKNILSHLWRPKLYCKSNLSLIQSWPVLRSHPKSCQWCLHHLRYTRSANKHPINSSLNSRQLNLPPVFKKRQTVQCLLKTLLLPTFNLNEPVQMLFILSGEEDPFMWNLRRMSNAETYSLHPQWDFITGLSFFSLACVDMSATIPFLLRPDAICKLLFTFGTLLEHYTSHMHYNPIGAI